MVSRVKNASAGYGREKERKLIELAGVGPAILEDLTALGITRVQQLARCDARRLHRRLCVLTGKRVDLCVQDVFSAAIAHARDPELDAERRCWWYWSRIRKNNGRA